MAIRALSQSQLWSYKPYQNKWGGTFVLEPDVLNKYKDDTFILIFSPGTDDRLKEFLKLKDKFKILFMNKKKAINTIHGINPRNTVVVFELNV